MPLPGLASSTAASTVPAALTPVWLARICLAGHADVNLAHGDVDGVPCPIVQVATDQPVRACMASQYAGWQISAGKFFAMGSGPMRAAYGTEEIFNHIPGRESPEVAVGVLRAKITDRRSGTTGQRQAEVGRGTSPLLAAPTASIAGTLQVVARSVETTLHKLYELKFDLNEGCIGLWFGAAAAGRGQRSQGDRPHQRRHSLRRPRGAFGRADDDELATLGPKVPASASADYGLPFAAIFKHSQGDFYKIDPLLFSPAVVVFNNVTSGARVFGRVDAAILRKSFLRTCDEFKSLLQSPGLRRGSARAGR